MKSRLPVRTRAAGLVFALLLAPASASADCAWVMWMGATIVRPRPELTNWSPVQATGTQQECEQERDAKITDFMRPSETIKKSKLGPYSLQEEGLATRWLFHREF